MASSVSPGTYSITMKKMPSSFSAVSTETMFGMVERGEQARLAQQLAEVEALLPVGHLERHLLVDPRVFREVDGTEPAAAQRRDDAVLAEHLPAEEHSAAVYQRRACPTRRTASFRIACRAYLLPAAAGERCV